MGKTDRKKRISRSDAIYAVALAGICAALALLLVWLSVVARYGTLGFFAAAGLVLMIPLHRKYYFSSVFAYAVSAGLSVLVGDIASVMGYILYFGPVTIALGIIVNKNVKWWIAIPFEIAYAVGVLALLYFVFGSVIVRYEGLADVKFWVLALVGTPVLVAINLILSLAYERIIPRVAKALRTNGDDENKRSNRVDSVQDDDESPFEELDTYIVPTDGKEKKVDAEKEDKNDEEKETEGDQK